MSLILFYINAPVALFESKPVIPHTQKSPLMRCLDVLRALCRRQADSASSLLKLRTQLRPARFDA